MQSPKKSRSRKPSHNQPPAGLQRGDADGYYSFFAHAREGLFRSTPEDHFTEVNPALVRMLGYNSAEEVLTLSLSRDVYADPAEREHLRVQYEKAGIVEGVEVTWKGKSGELIPVSLYARAIKNARGRVVTYEGMVLDVSAQRRAEENLLVSENKFRALTETIPAATFLYQGTRLLHVNPTAAAITGYTQEELQEMNFWDIVHPDFRQHVQERGMARLRGEEMPAHYELKILTKSGETRWVDFTTGVVELENAQAVIGVALDITARKQTEAELQQSKELFQRFMDSSPVLAYMKDEEGRYVYANKAMDRFFPHVLGKTDLDVQPAVIAEKIREHDAVARAASGVARFQETSEGVDGPRWWETARFLVLGAAGERLLAGMSFDVTKQKQLEEQLRESEERYRTVSEIASDYAYAFRVGQSGTLTLEWITAAFARISGLTAEEVMARGGWVNLPHPEDTPLVQRHTEAILAGQFHTSEFRIITKSGEVRWLRDSGRPVWDRELGKVTRFYGAGQDITDHKRLEEQLRERVIQPKDLGTNLRRFRQQLGLTQAVFGQTFGGYSQRQITSYETGEIEIPMGLLLTIRGKGYPLEVVLGESQTDALDKVVGYLSASWKTHETARRLTESVLRLLDRESATINSIMNRLGIVPEEDVSRESYSLREMLRRAGIEGVTVDASELGQNDPSSHKV